jgi:phytoene dehydrogenase-like protein
MSEASHYDVIVIGAGMSGLAASIRLQMYDKKVCLLEKHSITGGLNSYYQRGKRHFDVGLHALTNTITKGERGTPLAKILKQLRLNFDALDLSPQKKSQIHFPDHLLHFTNDIDFLTQEIRQHFPHQIDGWMKLREKVSSFDEVNLDNEYLSAKEVVKHFITDPDLLEMIFCPLLIYGSAWEHDMDFSQFVIMFKSIFIEGFSRPQGGVRKILGLLETRYQELGGERRMKAGVEKILTRNQKAVGVRLENGEEIFAPVILSSMGLPETLEKIDSPVELLARPGKMSFTECIVHLDKKPAELGLDSTIIFYNERKTYQYREPQELFDPQSAVICFPNNFERDDQEEGIIRITHMANYDRWNELKNLDDKKQIYKAQKELVYQKTLEILKKIAPNQESSTLFKDVFTPTTVERYTWHKRGAVYGSPDKTRRGLTPIDGLYIIGTDQGFLGIIGAMLSGISMANLYGLMERPT